MSASDRVPPRSDAMPTTRGTNFSLADPNLEFVCGWLDALVDWAPIPAEAVSAVTPGHP